ncbi:MAG: hypothetical protein QM769_04810 [Pseudoxanthomonas sp.]
MREPRLAIIVFARMSSSRLPGKVLMDFAGRPLLAHIIARAQALEYPVIVATSEGQEDAAVAEAAQQSGALAFRGSLDNVLQRAVDCAHAHGLDAFARLCGDRPFFPIEPMRQGLAMMRDALLAGTPLDLATNHLPENPPPGLSTEVVRVSALERVLAGQPNARHREHLTSGLYDDAGSYAMAPIPCDFSATRPHRFAVDTAEDYRKLGDAARQLGDLHASADAVAALLDREWAATR